MVKLLALVGCDGVQYHDRCVKSDVSGRELAVKKLADVETTSSARRVYNELCALTHLHHDNVRPVFSETHETLYAIIVVLSLKGILHI